MGTDQIHQVAAAALPLVKMACLRSIQYDAALGPASDDGVLIYDHKTKKYMKGGFPGDLIAALSTLASETSPAVDLMLHDPAYNSDVADETWRAITYVTWMMWHKEWIRQWVSVTVNKVHWLLPCLQKKYPFNLPFNATFHNLQIRSFYTFRVY